MPPVLRPGIVVALMGKLAAFLSRLASKAEAAAAVRAKSVYGTKEYWNGRYEGATGVGDDTEGVGNEWYLGFDGLKAPLLDTGYVPRTGGVLMLGCGLSTLGEDLARRGGVESLVGIDYSDVCVDKMNELPDRMCEYRCADVTDMRDFDDDSVACVLDKATLDSLMQEDDATSVRRMLAESSRVLRKGGTYVCLTYGDDRLAMLTGTEDEHPADYGWDVEHTETLRKGARARFYLYVLRKR